MTPAKLFALQTRRRERLHEEEGPIAQLSFLFANANRSPGEFDKNGNQTKPPAPVMPFEDFQMFKLWGKRAAEKVELGGDHNWRGAFAVKEQFTGA